MDLSNQYLRQAIYEVYKGKCFYTGNPIDYSNMELDHIIPRSYKNKLSELQKIISDNDLDNDFQVDSLINIVPTSKFDNGRKSNILFDKKTIKYYIALTKDKVPLIEESKEQKKKKANYYNHLSMLKAKVDEEDEKSNKQNIILDIIKVLTDEENEAREKEEIYYKDTKRIFRKYSNKIKLEALLPSKDSIKTECVLYFKTLNFRDSLLILDNKTILSHLFKGIFTNPIYGERSFIEAEENNTEDGSIDLESTELRVNLANHRLKLTSEDIVMLCEIIDEYAKQYIKTIKEIERELKTEFFSLSKRENNYKILRLPSKIWRKLVEFTFKLDAGDGDSKWHIFDRNWHYIKIYTRDHERFGNGYHAFFYAEHLEDIVLNPGLFTDDVYVTFEFIGYANRNNLENVNEKGVWNAEIAYNWITTELLPKFFNKGNIKDFDDKNDYVSLIKEFRVDRILYLKDKVINNHKDLKAVIESLQIYFHSNPHDKYRLTKFDFQGIYQSILLCINKTKNVDANYISNTLHLSDCITTKELVDSILEINNTINDTTIDGFGVDLLFRALIAAFTDADCLSIEEIHLIRNNVEYFVILRDRGTLLSKYAIEFCYE